jgi:hypothetical protein
MRKKTRSGELEGRKGKAQERLLIGIMKRR